MKRLFIILVLIISSTSSAWLQNTAHAQGGIGLGDTFQSEKLQLSGVSDTATTAEQSASFIFERAAQILFGFAATVALYFIILSGFILIKARGEEEKIKKAHETLMYALIGIVLVIVSYTLVVNLTKLIFIFIGGE